MGEMHKTGVSPEIIERVTQRRKGKRHVYDDLDPKRTALIVIDMQNVFLIEGQPAYCRYGLGIIPNVNRLAAGARTAGSPVVWIRMINTPDRQDEWSVYFDFFGRGNRDENAKATSEGAYGAELVEGLDISPEDAIMVKSRYSALVPGSSDLNPWLQARGIDTLIITGVATNICCESTARDAHMMNYKTIVVEDANATRTDELHTASLNTLCLTFADIMTTDEVLERLSEVPAASPVVAAE